MKKKNHKTQILSSFKEDLEQFSQKVNQLMQDSDLYKKHDFLKKIAEDMHRLYDSSIEVQKIQNEEAKEIGAIVQNIFIQPLTLKSHEQISIKNAIENFNPENESNCDLSFIMREYVSHPESTKSFVRELELLSEEFNTIIRHTA